MTKSKAKRTATQKHKQTRRSVSLNGNLYWKLKEYCDNQGTALSNYVTKVLEEAYAKIREPVLVVDQSATARRARVDNQLPSPASRVSKKEKEMATGTETKMKTGVGTVTPLPTSGRDLEF